MKKLAFKISFGLDYHKQLITVLALREGHMASLRKIVVQTKVGPEKKVDSLLLKNRMKKRFFPESAKYSSLGIY